jgi:hypothetical protein
MGHYSSELACVKMDSGQAEPIRPPMLTCSTAGAPGIRHLQPNDGRNNMTLPDAVEQVQWRLTETGSSMPTLHN